MHEFKIGDTVMWSGIDTVYVGEIMSLTARSALVSFTEDGVEVEKRVPLSALSYLPPIELDHEEYRALVRMESDFMELVSGNCTSNIRNSGGYRFAVEDLVCALEKIKAENIERRLCSVWISCFYNELMLQIPDGDGEFYSESHVLHSMAVYVYRPWDGGFDKRGIDGAITQGQEFIRDREKPLTDRSYPRYAKEMLLERLESDSAMAMASEDEVTLYRRFAEELAAEGNWYALRTVAYGCYGGNRAFPCDWERSRDCLLALFDIEDDDEHKAAYADTLGYIYYYGRCNGGEPEYELAYKYFSYAAFFGIYEAKYKVADMLKNGYGVPRSQTAAERIIFELYGENIKYIQNGDFGSKFADVALRMGGIYDNENNGEYYKALYYYTQAEFAIRMRMMHFDHYGDTRVCENITAALDGVKKRMEYRPLKSGVYRSVFFMDGELSDGRKYDMFIKKQRAMTYKITFTPHVRAGEKAGRKMFITLPEIGLCGLFPKLTVTYRAYKPLDDSLTDRVITVDERQGMTLMYDGAPVFEMNGDIVIRNGGTARSKKYRFVSVSFGSPKLYDYLCDDPSVGVGDTVWVNAAGEKKQVTICRVFEKKESELSFPVKVYKKIL